MGRNAEGSCQLDLPSSYITCPECGGKRFSDKILSVTYRGMTIQDVLETPVADMVDAFSDSKKISSAFESMVELGLGYLRLGQTSMSLSGGEAQKLMMARALYKNAPVLVLDEPTAALDPIAENEIYLQYRDMTEGKTSLFISHRLASTQFCDRVLFLQEGRITEEGTHSQLLEKGGEYARLYEIQSCWYRKEYKGEEQA